MAICAAPGTGDLFLSGTLEFLDCQARGMGADGYQALAGSGSPVLLALTSLLTVFVALYGVRMLLGRPIDVRSGVFAALNIGIVLLIATSWPAWRVIAYDVVLDGPVQISGLLGAAPDGLSPRLQAVDDGIVGLTLFGAGRLENAPEAGDAFATLQLQRSPPIADDLALGLARLSFLATTIGALGGIRLMGGILLALAPLFAGLLLFDATRGFFAGWLRALVASALGMLVATLVLSAELSLLEPWLGDTLARRSARFATPAAPVELFAITAAFAIMQLIALGLIARLSFSLDWLRVAAPEGSVVGEPQTTRVSRSEAMSTMMRTGGSLPAAEPSRALSVADALATTQRREAAMAGTATAYPPGRVTGQPGNNMTSSIVQASRRRTGGRVSDASARRDRRA